MNTFGQLLRPLVTLVAVAIAAVVGYALWDYYVNAPWTRDITSTPFEFN